MPNFTFLMPRNPGSSYKQQLGEGCFTETDTFTSISLKHGLKIRQEFEILHVATMKYCGKKKMTANLDVIKLQGRMVNTGSLG